MTDKANSSPQELWKPVPDAYGFEASNFGRVRGIVRPGGGNSTKWKILKGERINGYRVIKTVRNGVRKRALAHRLICSAFHGPTPGEEYTVDHIDGDRGNNRPENLEWVTRSENSRRQNADGRGAPKGQRHPMAKLTDYQVECIPRLKKSGWRIEEIARLFCVSESLIYGILSGRKRPHAKADCSTS